MFKKYIVLAIGLVSVVAASNVTAAQEDVFVKICSSAKVGDVALLKKTLKSARVKIRNIYPDLKCNGMQLMPFALSGGSHETAEFIIKKTKRRDLIETSGAPTAEWMIENGYDSSPAYTALIKKIG